MRATEVNVVLEDGTIMRWDGDAARLFYASSGLSDLSWCDKAERPVVSKPLRKVTEFTGSWSSLNNEVYSHAENGCVYPTTLRDLMPSECNTAGEPDEYRFRFVCDAVRVEEKP